MSKQPICLEKQVALGAAEKPPLSQEGSARLSVARSGARLVGTRDRSVRDTPQEVLMHSLKSIRQAMSSCRFVDDTYLVATIQ